MYQTRKTVFDHSSKHLGLTIFPSSSNFRENLSKIVETLQTSVKDWRGAKNNVNAFATKLTDSFWQLISDWMKWLFPRVRKSIRDYDLMKKFPYEFFMRSILSEILSKYEVSCFLLRKYCYQF